MEHPLIGAWTVTFEGANRRLPDYATAAFHRDGSLTVTVSGYTAHGAWREADSGAVRFRALAPLAPGEGQTGWHTLTFNVQVSDDGSKLSLDGTYERPTPSGNPVIMTSTGSGERLLVDLQS
jgi:hypothetical protein